MTDSEKQTLENGLDWFHQELQNIWEMCDEGSEAEIAVSEIIDKYKELVEKFERHSLLKSY